MEKFEKIKQLILAYEDGKISLVNALKAINRLLENEVTEYDLKNYWRSRDLDSYVRLLINEVYKDWISIDDQKALDLLKVMLESLDDELVFEKYAGA